MSAPFLAEIRIFAFNFAPTGWAPCNGQLLPISQNTALFALLGTYYGGDGKSTFALPDLNGAVPVHSGVGPDGSEYFLGQSAGSPTVSLLQTEMPFHSHSLSVSTRNASEKEPQNQLLAVGQGIGMYGPNTGATTALAPQAVAVSGSGLPHNNLQPSLALMFCIAMQGVFPQRP
jgi:microcystin-dependent protein